MQVNGPCQSPARSGLGLCSRGWGGKMAWGAAPGRLSEVLGFLQLSCCPVMGRGGRREEGRYLEPERVLSQKATVPFWEVRSDSPFGTRPFLLSPPLPTRCVGVWLSGSIFCLPDRQRAPGAAGRRAESGLFETGGYKRELHPVSPPVFLSQTGELSKEGTQQRPVTFKF